jgi:hypothetical protein
METSSSSRLLICLDFDQTIVKGHFHHLIGEEKNRLKSEGLTLDVSKYASKLLDDPSIGLKNSRKLKNVIQLGLKNRHHFAITSFSSYPESFTPTLLKLGLSCEESNQIQRYYGLPASHSAGKNEHLQRAMSHFHVVDRNLVYLVDDDPVNCHKAAANGFKTILVPVGGTESAYLDELLEILENFA